MTAAGPSRKQARRDAVFLLYQTEVTDLSMADLVEGQGLREGYAPDEFTIKAVAGVTKTRGDIDALLEAHAKDWPLDRIAPLEREAMIGLSLRRERLPLAVRHELFGRLAAHLESRLGVPRPPFFSEEKYVLNLTAVVLASGATT